MSRLREARKAPPIQLADAHGRSEQREGQSMPELLEVRHAVHTVAGVAGDLG